MTYMQTKPVATYDLYGPVHKGLRLAETNLLIAVGRTDPLNDIERSTAIERVREQCRIGEGHLEHEDRFIHPILEARSEGAAAQLAEGHAEHRETFAEIENLLQQIEAPGANLIALWRRLYLRLSQFVADDFAHMAEEELVIQPMLQTLFTDAELIGIEHTILASMEPQENMRVLGMMLDAADFSGRVKLLSGVRAGAPPHIFEAIVGAVVKPIMTEAQWTDLSAAIGA